MNAQRDDLEYLRPGMACDGSEVVRVIPPSTAEGGPLIVYEREPRNSKPNEICNDESCPYCYGVSLSRMHAVASAKEPTRESLRAEANAHLDAVGAAKRLEVRAELAAAGVPVPKVKKKRRTKDQLAAVRAERAARAKAATPEWLQEPDELLEAILTHPGE